MTKPILVACLIGVLSFFGLSEKISGLASAVADKDMLVRWANVLSGVTRQGIPVTLLDIDEETLTLLGRPERTPRDLVANLLQMTLSKKPHGLFLDIDTSRPGVANADQKLTDMISQWPGDAPPLALARKIETRGGKNEAAASILDEAVHGHDNVLFVASVTQIEDDRILRRWQLSETFCNGKIGTSLASPQLVAAAIGKTSGELQGKLTPFLQWRNRADCAKDESAQPQWPRNAENTATIPFLFGTSTESCSTQSIERSGVQVPLFCKISVRSLIGNDGKLVPVSRMSEALLKDRFIIIGASHGESLDTHQTPLGLMPGALVVANAIATAPTILDAKPLSPLSRTLIALAIFGVLAALAIRLRAIVAGLLGGLVALVMLIILGRNFAPSTAFEIVASAIAMAAFFSGLEAIYEIAHSWRSGQGWRAMLKPAAVGKGGAL